MTNSDRKDYLSKHVTGIYFSLGNSHIDLPDSWSMEAQTALNTSKDDRVVQQKESITSDQPTRKGQTDSAQIKALPIFTCPKGSYYQHPLTSFHKLIPNAPKLRQKVKSLQPNQPSDSVIANPAAEIATQLESDFPKKTSGGVSFTIDFNSLPTLPSNELESVSMLPRRCLQEKRWQCVSRPQLPFNMEIF